MNCSSALVTGGAGFIGSHLVELLLNRGVSVRILDIRVTPAVDDRAEFVLGSILDRQTLSSCMVGMDYVFHLAADPNLWSVNKKSFFKINYDGTMAILEEAGRAKVQRIIYTSTESILKGKRRSGSDGLTNEEAVRGVEDMPGPYCQSKFLAERAASRAAASGLPVVIVNPTLPVGPGDYGITPPTRMLLDFLNGELPAYLDFWMNLIHVRDIALGHLLAAEKGKIGERYILGNENLRLSEVLGMLSELTGLPMPSQKIPYSAALCFAMLSEFVADRITHTPPKAPLAGVRLARSTMRFDSSKAYQELGLRPVPVRAALEEAIAWFAKTGKMHRHLRAFHLEGLGKAISSPIR